MIQFPDSTKVNRFLAKEKFYRQTTVSPKVRQLLTDEIEKITWTNKIAPDTLNITAGQYGELQVLELLLKGADISRQTLQHIDTYIPYPILFILKSQLGQKAVISFKEISAKNQERMKVDTYFQSSWQSELNLVIKGRSVDEIYQEFLFQIAPQLRFHKTPNAKTAIEKNKEQLAPQKQIDALNKSIANEISIAKKQELARQRYNLEKRMKDI